MKLEKKYIIIIAIAIVVLSLFGGTYAFWLWRGNITKISYTTELPFSCAADGGVHASTVALAPAACTHDRFAIQREIKITPEIFSTTTSVFVDLILKIEQIGTGLSNSSNFKYAITSDPNSCTNGVYTSGNFKNKTAGTTITILNDDVFNYSPSSLTRSYYLYIWIDPVEENPDVLVQDFSFSLSAECTQGAKTATGGAAMLINKANGEDITNYEDGDTGEMYTFSQPATDQVAATTDYRYIGDSPNNYITFNDETWRIIGVFDGKIKIIKDESMINFSFDNKKTGIGSSTTNYGSNDWVDSQLMYMLNQDDIATHVAKKTGYTFDGTNVKDASGNIIYQKGCKPAAASGSSYSCTTNTWSLNSTALSQAEDTIYYLGGTSQYSGLSVTGYYTFERGLIKYDDARSTNWSGKVGLIYLSDYGYTFAYGVDESCYNNLASCSSSSSWLYDSMSWAITPAVNSTVVESVIYSNYTVRISDYVTNSMKVRPVVYLNPNINLTGSGTIDDKYQIVSQSSGGSGGNGGSGSTGTTMLINKANAANVTTYSSGDTGEMYTFSQPETEQVPATTDYRYIGDSPNNYITFNNETWRIIGVFDDKIKIIRDERIMNAKISWDYKKTGIGSSTSDGGSNDWVDSQLMYMLNNNDIATHVAKKTGYTFDGTNVKDSSGNIIYQKGCRPASVDGTTTYSCTANTWSLNSTALSQIEDTIYYLGGTGSNSGKSAADYYTFERGEAKFNDTRSTNWTGKVGLMYPSDYAYTFAYGVDDTCYSNTYTCNNSTPASSWLYNSSYSQWTIPPGFGNANHVFLVYSSGHVSFLSASSTYGVRPVVYLKSDITLTGSGTVDDKYQIVSQSSGGSGGNGGSGSTGSTMLINKANAANVTTYTSGNEGEMYTFSQPATTQVAATTDYRYIGDSPNNYITFNDETWRIIGVFDGRIKIIRDDRIMNTGIRWDYKKTGIGSSTTDSGSNDWVDAQLMYMLNDNDIATHVAKKTGYTFDGTNVKDASGNIIYQKGCRPAAVDGTTTYSCTANTWSLNSTALSQIEDTIYYLGGTSTASGQSATSYYTSERGEAKFNDTRSTNWTGKVGLMYPSDYAYTFAYGVDDTCYSNTNTCNNSTPASSWLYKSSFTQWTLAPLSSYANSVFYVGNSGGVSNFIAYTTSGVRPVVYLKSDITLTGSGTVDDKYVIS